MTTNQSDQSGTPGRGSEDKGTESRPANTSRANEGLWSAFADFGRVINFLSDAKELLGWLLVGPVLIVIGVTQGIFGWAGNTIGMRVGYSAACILFGLLLTGVIVWLLIPDDAEESELDKDPNSDPQDDER